jgi:hypothetical protein
MHLLASRQRRHALGIGRVLINAQIAAGYGFTLRLRHGDAFLRHAYLQKIALTAILDQAHNSN